MFTINPVSKNLGWDQETNSKLPEILYTWKTANMLTSSHQGHPSKWIKLDFYPDYQELVPLMNELSIIGGWNQAACWGTR